MHKLALSRPIEQESYFICTVLYQIKFALVIDWNFHEFNRFRNFVQVKFEEFYRFKTERLVVRHETSFSFNSYPVQ